MISFIRILHSLELVTAFQRAKCLMTQLCVFGMVSSFVKESRQRKKGINFTRCFLGRFLIANDAPLDLEALFTHILVLSFNTNDLVD